MSAKFNAAFWKWFGDSKVVGSNGDPLVVYHGTLADFKKFDMSKAGSRFPAHKTDGAMWFSESPDEANGYLDYDTYAPDHKQKGGVVMPCYLRMENPAVVDATKEVQSDLWVKVDGKKVYEIRYIKKRFVQYAKEDGHDGVIFLNGYDNVPSIGALFAVFSASQIKSAIGNDGSFDSDDEDVRSNPRDYLGIGHDKGGVLWLWRNGRLETRADHSTSHDDIWPHTGSSWYGRYDPKTKEISVHSPVTARFRRPPEDLLDALAIEFDSIKFVEFNPPRRIG